MMTPKLNRIHADRLYNRQKDRRQNQNRRGRIHNHSDNQQEYIDDQKDRNRAVEVVQDKLADRLRYLHQRQHTGKCRRCRQNKQDRGEGTNRLNQNGPDAADADTPVHKRLMINA